MTNDEAKKLARTLKVQLEGSEDALLCHVIILCDYILSGSIKREIENAAYERAAVQFDRLGCVEASKTCRSLIQPPAQKENGE